MSDTAVHRLLQILLLVFCVPMLWGARFIHAEHRDDEHRTATYTYTLYSTLPPSPEGPSFCRDVAEGNYAVEMPCDWKPPFLWWLERRLGRPV